AGRRDQAITAWSMAFSIIDDIRARADRYFLRDLVSALRDARDYSRQRVPGGRSLAALAYQRRLDNLLAARTDIFNND
ncbi:MAG: hypothetical protein C5B53_04140, partial [Candidatus Melainabacteria bacterium]